MINPAQLVKLESLLPGTMSMHPSSRPIEARRPVERKRAIFDTQRFARLAAIAAFLILAGAWAGALAQLKWPAIRREAYVLWVDVSGPSSVTILPFGSAATQSARFASSTKPAPLVIDLHQWSESERGTLGDDIRLDKAITDRGWNYIRPALAGPNDNPRACCSRAVIDGMQAAIHYAIQHGRVDQRAIYVVGESGGGYTGLCGAQSGVLPVRAYHIWVPITDLTSWHSVHKFDHYGDDIMTCTASLGYLNVAEARRRSPIYMSLPKRMPIIKLYHGIRDGIKTAVSPEQTINYFNRVAIETGFSSSMVSQTIKADIMYQRVGPDEKSGRKIGKRTIHLYREAGKTSLTIFEGYHESLIGPTVADIDRDWRAISRK